jgi:hypothetical protein
MWGDFELCSTNEQIGSSLLSGSNKHSPRRRFSGFALIGWLWRVPFRWGSDEALCGGELRCSFTDKLKGFLFGAETKSLFLWGDLADLNPWRTIKSSRSGKSDWTPLEENFGLVHRVNLSGFSRDAVRWCCSSELPSEDLCCWRYLCTFSLGEAIMDWFVKLCSTGCFCSQRWFCTREDGSLSRSQSNE